VARNSVRFALVLLSVIACSRGGEVSGTDRPQGDALTHVNPLSGEAARFPLRAGEAVDALPQLDGDIEDEDEIELLPNADLEVAALAHFTEVRAEPNQTAPLLGVLAPSTRIEVYPAMKSDDCSHGWREIAPRGFVCAKVEPTKQATSDEYFPRLPKGALVPGVYGKMRSEGTIFADAAAVRAKQGAAPSAALTVRRFGTETIDGRTYWRTRHGLVAASDIRKLDSSGFSGMEIDDGLATPRVWARFRGKPGTIALHSAPRENAPIQARLKARHTAKLLETSPDGAWVKLDRGGWAKRDEVRVAKAATAPDGIGADERWIDIDLDEQVLVAYVGTRAVYATLVSSGKRTHDTPTGVFRIERKVAERTMSSRPDDDDPYAVDRVPWTAYFIGSYALHTAYWHGSFGEKKSHGCVNLAPKDARRLYGWTAPGVLPGYTEIHGNAAQPGAVIRIRSTEDPTQAWQGYAAAMREPATHG
jgi:lipoprotein-anchoring transpeptidase ErfK/SrfK